MGQVRHFLGDDGLPICKAKPPKGAIPHIDEIGVDDVDAYSGYLGELNLICKRCNDERIKI